MPRKPISEQARNRAKQLRANMSESEWRLWNELKYFRRAYGFPVRRQVPIGPYVADFVIQSEKLVIEVDGEHHNSHRQQRHDTERDKWFEEAGYQTLRFNTGELYENLDGCIDHLLNLLNEKSEN